MVQRKAIRGAAAGFKQAERELAKKKQQEEARKNQAHMPFRFKVGVGETTQFIVCDDEPWFFRHEHTLKDPRTGRWNVFTGCVAESDVCPVCDASGKEATYTLYLTVIDLTPFSTKDGVEVEFSRKLLAVKLSQQKKFQRAYAKAEAKGITLRGALFEVSRDGDRDAAIGNDIELVEWVDEDEMETYTRSWKDKEGKKHTEVCHEVLDYEELFPEQDADELRALVGGEPPMGSRRQEENDLGMRKRPSRTSKRRASEDEDEDDNDFEKPERNERMSARKSRGRAADPDDEPDQDDEPDDEPPRRAGRRAAPERAAPSRRTRAKANEDPDDDDPVKEAAPRGRGRPRAPVEDDDEPRPSRRVSMRRGR